jgi:1-acyl-sn-glycerol-3-phosphate acyltransferase
MKSGLPHRSPFLVRWFTWYARRFLRKNFHAVRLARLGRPPALMGEPLLVVLNHPSWWDPLIGIALTDLFAGYRSYAAMDAGGLSKYPLLKRLGFFAVEPGTVAGAREFLRKGQAALAESYSALWVTGQGQFTDPRQRPVQLREGVGYLIRHLDKGIVLPLALEYPFWGERYPEALAQFGQPIVIGSGRDLSVAMWMEKIEAGLTQAQDALASAAQKRDASAFETLIGGKVGIGGVYDLWRRGKSLLRGRQFHGGHGAADDAQRSGQLGGVS